MDGTAWTNGRIVLATEATVPLLDRGHLIGDGVFETLRTAGGRIFRAEDHMDRMRNGLRTLGLDVAGADVAQDALHALAADGMERFGPDLYLRIQVTAGTMEDVAGSDGLHVTGLCRPFRPYPMAHHSKGIRAITSPHRKLRGPLCTVKSTSFALHVAARRDALAQAAHDAILCNDAGRPCEATTSNLFVLHDGTVHAPGPDEGALAGVTRDAVLELIAETGIPVTEPLTMNVLRNAEEAFLTNTIGGIVPLTRLDDAPIGNGSKGPFTTRLATAYDALLHQ